MMVRDFLRICHLACAMFFLLCAWSESAIAQEMAAGNSSVAAAIDKFMHGYARDLAKRLGPGSRVEYDRSRIATLTETRACGAPPAIEVRDQAQTMNRVMLQVACGNDWSIYVPIDLDVLRPVVVALKPLASGSVVAASDVELSALDVGQISGTYLTALEEVVGMGVKRPLAPGRPILAQQLEQPLLIRRGESVVISAQSGDLAVKMTGTAMTDGRRGELIRIKNQTSSRIIDARVTGPGQVVVPM